MTYQTFNVGDNIINDERQNISPQWNAKSTEEIKKMPRYADIIRV